VKSYEDRYGLDLFNPPDESFWGEGAEGDFPDCSYKLTGDEGSCHIEDHARTLSKRRGIP
jgi:hypothetical protein